MLRPAGLLALVVLFGAGCAPDPPDAAVVPVVEAHDVLAVPFPPTADGAAPSGELLEVEPVASLDSAPGEFVGVAGHPDGSMLAVDRLGLVRRVEGGRIGRTWLDLTDRVLAVPTFERGLFSLAFSPEGDEAYVHYTDIEGGGDNQVVAVPLAGGRPVIEDARTLLSIEQPAEVHNGGDLQVTSDGMLWISVGDGGRAFNDTVDPATWTSQSRADLRGAVLRIDPTPAETGPYTIPPDNPYVGEPDTLWEIWAKGLRNPWQIHVDEPTGVLWIGDVGDRLVEEVDVVRRDQAGANLGWPYWEGRVEHFPGRPQGGFLGPLVAYEHDVGCAVIGGPVVRGGPASLEGAYLYGDLCSREIVALRVTASGVEREVVAVSPAELTSISQVDGDVYLTSRKPGAVFRLADAPAPAPADAESGR